jgi:uncharacterized membrane-anchored protein YhcB (DUF1043 family)
MEQVIIAIVAMMVVGVGIGMLMLSMLSDKIEEIKRENETEKELNTIRFKIVDKKLKLDILKNAEDVQSIKKAAELVACLEE